MTAAPLLLREDGFTTCAHARQELLPADGLCLLRSVLAADLAAVVPVLAASETHSVRPDVVARHRDRGDGQEQNAHGHLRNTRHQ